VTRRTLLWVRWGVFAAACAFLVVRLERHQGMHGIWPHPFTFASHGPVLAGVLVLMLANWSVEVLKWRLLMRPVQSLSFGRAFTATLAGTTVGLITPNRVGEFAGRVLFLDPEHRVEGGFATLLGSIAQFVSTLLMGGLAMLAGGAAVHGLAASPLLGAVVMWSAFLIGCAAVALYFSPATFGRLLLAIPWLRRFERHARVLDTIDRGTLRNVLVLSLARYAVFTLQFALLAHALAGTGLVSALRTVPVVFLVTTLVPTTALTELGVRSSVAATFIPGDEAAIVAASALLWVVNLVVPALAGGVALLVARIRTERSTP
jgi:hypothetical protein